MFEHVTVMKNEAVEGLSIRPDGVYVDCTLGGAGHSQLIASQLGEQGLLIAFDQDDQAIAEAKRRLEPYGARVKIVRSNFRYIRRELANIVAVDAQGTPKVDGILFDLGVSSPQLDQADRGFSYNQDAALDMRMDQTAPFNAYQLVNEWTEAEIAKVLFEYGEEKFARRIAGKIVREREKKLIETTGELTEIIKEGIPAAARRTGSHPAKRSFQAIRIAVNDELGAFEQALTDSMDCLHPHGRLSVITFHSLEDRICKKIVQQQMESCICPPDLPMCACDRKPSMRWVKRKPILPAEEELADNPRARSAKLRVAEKL